MGHSPPVSSALARMIKLHALFGNELILSDIQIIDSSFILEQFSDPEFRRFLKEYPTFFHLVAKPQGQGPRRFSIATSGIRRSAVTGWVSSAFEDAHPVKELGQAILSAKSLDPSQQLLEDRKDTIGHIVRIKWPKYHKRLEGTLWAVDHFASESSRAPVAEPPSGVRIQSFFEVLESIAGNSVLFPEYEKYIDQTIKHITTNVKDEQARHRRSMIYETLDKNGWPDKHQIVWHTVIQAWNCAVQNTMGAEGGSQSNLPLSAPVGVYLDRPTDALVPTTIRNGKIVNSPFSGKILVPFLNRDPATLSWNEIIDVCNKTTKTRDGFQTALLSTDLLGKYQAVEQHVNALAACLEKRTLPHMPNYLWLIAAGVAIWIGEQNLGAIILPGGKLAYDSVSDLLRGGYKFFTANTLRESAYKMMPVQRDES